VQCGLGVHISIAQTIAAGSVKFCTEVNYSEGSYLVVCIRKAFRLCCRCDNSRKLVSNISQTLLCEDFHKRGEERWVLICTSTSTVNLEEM